MNNLPKLFIIFGDLEISLIVGHYDDLNSFKLLEKLILPIDGISEHKVVDLDKITNGIKKNIFIIEQKVNYTFKDIIIILDNFKISFLNLSGFKKLNGTQISKENITYILNSLKSCVEEFEENKKILHIFSSEYCLDNKKLDNLPIGLFGDFYSHELSFNLMNENDHKNLENIFKLCNLNIKKILLESFVKGSLINEANPKINTFFHIRLNENNSKIFFIENNSVKYEQKFNFGTKTILNDISKIISLNLDLVRTIIKNIVLQKNLDTELIDKKYFGNQPFRKVKKKLILDIAEARIREFSDLLFHENIDLKKSINRVKVVFLEIADERHLKSLNNSFLKCFSYKDKYVVKIYDEFNIANTIDTAYRIYKFGWKKEAIPVIKTPRSFISKIFQSIFN